MKRIHLLRVDPESNVEDFRSLIDAVRTDGGRVGWLVWRPHEQTSGGGPTAGLLRHVEVDAVGSVARKPRLGPAVLRDVLREHFRGCRVVLVAGAGVGDLAEVNGLAPSEGGVRVGSDGSAREMSAEDLAARLRSPKFP